MSALVRSLCRHSSTPLAAVFVLVACATAEDPGGPSNGGSPPASAGTGVGGGGTSSTAGMTSAAGTLPIVTGGLPSTSGGSGSTTGGHVGSGGTGTGTAGTGTGTAGTGTATGGTGSGSTCPQYSGTQAKDSTIFNGGFGTSKTGSWTGYGYTYKYGTGVMISPGMGQNCFMNLKMCANGTVPADDASGAGLGWNISQTAGSSSTSKVAITTPVSFKLAGATAGMRVQLSANSTTSYCYTLTAADVASATVPLASFKTECWGTTGVAYDGSPIEAIQVVVPGAAAAAKTFDFCILDIEPGAATP